MKHRFVRRITRWLMCACLVAMLTPLVLVGTFYQPMVQRWMAEKGMQWLSARTGYTVSAERVRIFFPLRLQVEGICVSQGPDTLVAVSRLRSDMDVRALVDGVFHVRYVALTTTELHTDTLLKGINIHGRVGRIGVDELRFTLADRALQVHEVRVDAAEVAIGQWMQPETSANRRNTFPLTLSVHRIQGSHIAIAYSMPSGVVHASVPRIQADVLQMDTVSDLSLQHVALREGNVHFISHTDSSQELEVSDVRFVIDSLRRAEGNVGGVLSQMEFTTSYDFELQQGSLAFVISDDRVSLPHFMFLTDASHLRGHLHLEGQRVSEWVVDGDVAGAVGYADVQRLSVLVPHVQSSFWSHYPNDSLTLAVAVSGPVGALRVRRLQVAHTAFDVLAEGRVDGLPDVRRLRASMGLSVRAHDMDILASLLDSATLRRLTLPHAAQVSGTLNYAPDTLDTYLAVLFDGGALTIDASACPSQRYYALTLAVDSLPWGGYTYSNAQLAMQLHDHHLQVQAAYADTLLRLHLNGYADYSATHLQARLSLRLSDVNLRGMEITDVDIRPSLQSHWTLDVDSTHVYTVRAHLYDMLLVSPQRIVEPQPMSLRARMAPDSLSLSLRAGDLRLAATGHSRGLPWQWSMPIDIALPDRARVLTNLHLTLHAGSDNPVSNYLALVGLTVDALHAEVYERESSLVAEARVGALSLKEMHCDTALVTATFDGDVLHAQLRADAVRWYTPSVQLDGSLGGHLTWHGTRDRDSLQGMVRLSGLRMYMPTYSLRLQSRDTLELPFVHGKLLLDALPLYAVGSRPLLLHGEVSLLSASPSVDLRLQARNVSLLQPSRTLDALLYGPTLMSGDVSLTGPLTALRLEGSVDLRGGSSLHYIYKDISLAAGRNLDDVVSFVDFASSDTDAAPLRRAYLSKGFTMDLKVSIEPTVQLEILLGSNGENRATLQGGGALNVQYIPAVGIRLSGRYTVETGELTLNIPLLHVHSMTIVPGSMVQWSGNASNPQVNVTVEDRIRASVSIDDAPQTVLFVAGVSLSDTMERLGLQFNLSAPENASMQNILAALSPDERSKLTVALLTTGLYLGEGGTGNLMNTALLGFLQAQLDNISRDTFRSVDVSFGIEPLQDGVNGVSTRTYYSYSVAKRLWSDRIRIVIGGSVTTMGDRIADNAFIDNISVEWRIRPNGSQYLRFFYDNNYESVLEGEIRETGVGYVYRRKF